MKRFILPCLLSLGLCAASRNENLQVIVEKNYFQEQMTPFLNMLATQAAGEKTVDTEALIAKFRKEVFKEGNLEKFCAPYKDVFSDEEVAELRAMIEHPVWQKYMREGTVVAQAHVQVMRDLFQELVANMEALPERASHIVAVTKETEDLLSSQDTPVILDIQAKWCAPCKMMNPILEDLAEKYQDQLRFLKVDCDESPELAQSFGVKSLPTLIFLKPGDKTPALKHAGFLTKQDLEEKIEAFLESLEE